MRTIYTHPRRWGLTKIEEVNWTGLDLTKGRDMTCAWIENASGDLLWADHVGPHRERPYEVHEDLSGLQRGTLNDLARHLSVRLTDEVGRRPDTFAGRLTDAVLANQRDNLIIKARQAVALHQHRGDRP